MTDDLVKRLRLQADTSLMRLPEDHVYVSHKEAADRIEELEKHFQHAIAIFAMMRAELYVVGEVMREFPSE